MRVSAPSETADLGADRGVSPSKPSGRGRLLAWRSARPADVIPPDHCVATAIARSVAAEVRKSDRGFLGARSCSAGTVASAITRNTPSLARIHHSPGAARPRASVSRTSPSELGLPHAGNGAPPPYQPERRPASVERERGRSRSLCWCPQASSDSGQDPHRLLVCVMSGRVGLKSCPRLALHTVVLTHAG